MLRWLVVFLSFCGFAGWGLMFLFIIGMSGFGNGRANSLVVFTLATPLAFFFLCFQSAAGKWSVAAMRTTIPVVLALSLPFFWYLLINGPAGWAGAAILVAFLCLWILVCRRQMRAAVPPRAPAGPSGD